MDLSHWSNIEKTMTNFLCREFWRRENYIFLVAEEKISKFEEVSPREIKRIEENVTHWQPL